jgi:hypothetical protein
MIVSVPKRSCAQWISVKAVGRREQGQPLKRVPKGWHKQPCPISKETWKTRRLRDQEGNLES